MYVLFIPSFPNNRFHLGNIRKTSLSKKERKRKKKNKKQKFSLFVTNNCAYCIVWRFCENFCYFIFCFYILYDGKRVALILLRLIFLKLLFLFFLFLFFFWKQLKVSLCETCKYGSDLSYSIFVLVFWQFAKKHVAVRATQVRLFVFRVTWFSVGVSP